MSYLKSLSISFLCFIAAPALTLKAQDTSPPIIKVEKIDEVKYLLTPVATYQNAQGIKVDFVGAIHIGDRAYYEMLNERFKSYDKVLYEMVNGKYHARFAYLKKLKQRSEAEEAEYQALLPQFTQKKDNFLGGILNFLYSSMGSTLKLSPQVGVVDYGFEHFVHADMSDEELSAAMKKRGESWLGMLAKEVLKPSERHQPNMLELFTRLRRAKDTSAVLRELVIDVLASESESALLDSAIIVSRNEKAMEVLSTVLKDSQDKKLAIFYGSAHLPDFHERLQKLGFKLKSVDWIIAFSSKELLNN